MKNIIYIILAAVLIFSSLLVLLFYYTQDFNENFSFSVSIKYNEIEIKSSPGYGYQNSNATYLQEAKAKLGELNLENNGYFTQKYALPTLMGCINFFDSIDKNSELYKNNRFNVNFDLPGAEDNYNYYSNSRNTLNIKVGEEKTIEITGVYNSYGIPLSEFSLNNIKSISIYRLPEKENNPLSEGYNYYIYNNRGSCQNIESDLKPIKIIFIN